MKAIFMQICYNISMSYNIKDLKQQFLEYIEIERGRSVKTVENYDRYLTRFLNYSKTKSPEDITENTIREFRLWLNRQLASENGKSKETLKKKTEVKKMAKIYAPKKIVTKKKPAHKAKPMKKKRG